MSVRWALGEKAWSGNVRFSGGARMGPLVSFQSGIVVV
jgi:hypothetical protein